MNANIKITLYNTGYIDLEHDGFKDLNELQSTLVNTLKSTYRKDFRLIESGNISVQELLKFEEGEKNE